jgi:hypothetical protein
MASLPSNAHVSQHPCLQAKLSQLRSASTSSKDVQALVHDIALMVGYEALAQGLKVQHKGTVRIASMPPHLPWTPPALMASRPWAVIATQHAAAAPADPARTSRPSATPTPPLP